MAERLVLASFNLCWEAEQQGGFRERAVQNGYTQAPQTDMPLYYRDGGGSVVFILADFEPGADGKPEPVCRVIALKPQIDSSFVPKHAVLPFGDVLVNKMIAETTNMGAGYGLVYQRQRHPTRLGRLRTLMRAQDDGRARILYIEEAPQYYEFVYVHAADEVANDPRTLDMVMQPSSRAGMQAFVDDKWEIDFCNLNPHACVTDAQLAQQERLRQNDSRTGWALPFSGIGSTGSGDNRSNQQKSEDKAWWENYHRCGSGKC